VSALEAPPPSRWRQLDGVLLIVVVLVLVALVLHVVDLGVRAMHHDESLHATFSWYLTDGRGYRHDPLMHGPFQFHVIAVFFAIFGDSETIARLPAALLGTALVATPLLLRRWLGGVGVVATSLFLMVSPSLLYFSRFARNDIFVAVWTVLLVTAVWRYREDGRGRWLVVLAAALSLSFATKETAYLFSAMLLLYLSVTLAMSLSALTAASPRVLNSDLERTGDFEATRDPSWVRLLLLIPLGWVIAALWPLLGGLRRRWGWTERPREVDLLVVAGTLIASQIGAAIQVPLSAAGLELDVHDETVLGAVGVTVLLLGGAAVGLAWNWRSWAIAALVFYAIYVPLFTTGFTNLDGFGSGIWGSLDYWLDQQDVNRGNQPAFYYFMLLPIYELLTLIPALIGGVWLLWRRDGFAALLMWWFIFTFIALSVAGEKMPWLTVHLALPLAFLAGHVVGRLLPGLASALWDRRAPVVAWAGAGAAASVTVLLFAFTVRSGIALSFGHPDTPLEPLIYTQTSPEVPLLARQIEEAAFDDPEHQRPIYVDTTASLTWPWAWYLRHLEVSYESQETFRGGDLPEGAILVAALNTITPTDPLRSDYQEAIRYRHRWWFPEGGYRQTDAGFLVSGISDGSLIATWWSFLLDRADESTLGSLDGEVLFPE
jgi:predicted membrane-bound mannosyltransferase